MFCGPIARRARSVEPCGLATDPDGPAIEPAPALAEGRAASNPDLYHCGTLSRLYDVFPPAATAPVYPRAQGATIGAGHRDLDPKQRWSALKSHEQALG